MSFVVEIDGMVVGYFGLYFELNLCWCYVVVFGMMVDVVCYGCGIGGWLFVVVIDFVENWLNIMCFELIVFIDNCVVIVFYEKYGFCIEGELLDYVLCDGVYVFVYYMVWFKVWL